MRVAIVTLPLHTNYGGLLQAYALKMCLEQLGHEATVLDLEDKMPAPETYKAPFVYARRFLGNLLSGKSAKEVFRERRFKTELPVVGAKTKCFIDNYISPRVLKSYSQLTGKDYDAFIVGSDQVWRPRYFPGVKDAFLDFAKGWNVRRIAYAASFGTDELEYESPELEKCTELLRLFDAVAVREESGVRMCSEWFDRDDAMHVLDPVMLLDSERYVALAEKAPEHPAEGKVVTYILDKDAHKQSVIDFMSRVIGRQVHDISVSPYDKNIPLQDRVVPSLEQWLAGFADAEFVVTDSFHGCVLSILLHKRFIVVGNSSRGLARMQSLVDMFGLDQRLVQGIDPEDDGEFFASEPDWESVDKVLENKRTQCLEYLMNNLK